MLTFFTPVTSAMKGCGDGEKRATYSLPVSALLSCRHLLHTDAFVWNRGRPHKHTTHWSVSSFGWMAHIYQRALSVWSLNCEEFFGECVASCEHLEETTLLSLSAHWCGVKTNSCHRGNFFFYVFTTPAEQTQCHMFKSASRTRMFCPLILHLRFPSSLCRGISVQLNHSISAWRVRLHVQHCNEDELLLELCSRAGLELRVALNPPFFFVYNHISTLSYLWRTGHSAPQDIERAGAFWGWRSGRFEEEEGEGSDVILDGENQARAAAQELLLAGVQLTLQRFLWGAAAPFAVRAPARPSRCVPSAAGRPIGRDGGVAKHEGQVAVVTEEVRVVVPQLLVVLKTHPHLEHEGRDGEHGGDTHTHTQM